MSAVFVWSILWNLINVIYLKKLQQCSTWERKIFRFVTTEWVALKSCLTHLEFSSSQLSSVSSHLLNDVIFA